VKNEKHFSEPETRKSFAMHKNTSRANKAVMTAIALLLPLGMFKIPLKASLLLCYRFKVMRHSGLVM
jgi:hypothetical protein